MDLGTLVEIFGALESRGVRYLIVGGVAVDAHGYIFRPRISTWS